MENRQVDDGKKHPVLKHKTERIPIKIAFTDTSAADERYGGSGDVAILEGELIKPVGVISKSCVIFMHPSGIQNLLPMPNAMAKSGIHVITCASRYPNNDTCLIMEKVAVDLGACVKYTKERLGYKKVVLAGWSGGGSLSTFYQAQAEKPTVTHTPAGDEVNLKKARLIPADGLLVLAAHISRAKIFTEWLDPAVLDENDLSKRDESLDLFNPKNRPPFTKEFVAKYRQAQIERNRRITDWCKARLGQIEKDLQNPKIQQTWQRLKRDEVFSVNLTQADIRRFELEGEENSIEQMARENHSPVGLAKCTTLRAYLSQWSYDLSVADGPSSMKNVTKPVLVLANGHDHLVPKSHPDQMFAAITHDKKEYHVIEGATHYYFGQTDLMASAVVKIAKFLVKHDLLEKSILDEMVKGAKL